MQKYLVGLALTAAFFISGCEDDLASTVPMTPAPTLIAYTVVASRADAVSVFNLDTGRGALTPVVGSPFLFPGALPNDVVIAPNGQFVYVSAANDQILALRLNHDTGALTALPGSPVALSFPAFSAAIDNRGRYLYTYGATSLDGFSIDASTGQLTRLPGFPLTFAGGQLRKGVFDATNRFFYVSDLAGTVRAFAVADSGALTELVGSPFATGSVGSFALALDSSNQFLYNTHVSGGITGFRVNGATGVLTPLTTGFPVAVAAGSDAAGLSVRNQELFAGDSINNETRAFLIGADGSLTALSGSPFPFGGASEDPVPNLPFVVSADYNDARVNVGRIDGAGALSQAPLSPAPVAPSPFGVRTVVFTR